MANSEVRPVPPILIRNAAGQALADVMIMSARGKQPVWRQWKSPWTAPMTCRTSRLSELFETGNEMAFSPATPPIGAASSVDTPHDHAQVVRPLAEGRRCLLGVRAV